MDSHRNNQFTHFAEASLFQIVSNCHCVQKSNFQNPYNHLLPKSTIFILPHVPLINPILTDALVHTKEKWHHPSNHLLSICTKSPSMQQSASNHLLSNKQKSILFHPHPHLLSIHYVIHCRPFSSAFFVLRACTFGTVFVALLAFHQAHHKSPFLTSFSRFHAFIICLLSSLWFNHC